MIMLPPIEPALAASNPKFDVLYRDLCTHKLNVDGTSVVGGKARKERETLHEELHKARVESARRDLIQEGLQRLACDAEALPEELRDLVAIVAAILDGHVAEEDRMLLQDDIAKFKANIATITTALREAYAADTNLLCGMLSPNDSPLPKDLPDSIARTQDSTINSRSSTASARLTLAQEASALHNIYRQIMEASIRILEQTIHGSVARGTKAKADHLALVAEGMSKKLQLQYGQLQSQVYSTEMSRALEERNVGLQRDAKAVRTKIREGEEKLEDYGKVRGMDGVAGEYAELLRETEKVSAEIRRLETSG